MDDRNLSNKAYLEVIKALHKLLREEYVEGGWLPSGRDLAKMLGFSHATCCKALQRMVREGFVKNYPKRGHYAVPKYLHCRKIGLFFGNGEESPFIRNAPTVPNAIRHLNDAGFDVQVIQHSRTERLHDNAVIHGVEGVLWFWPTCKSLKMIQKLRESDSLPLVAVCPDCATLTPEDLSADCYVRLGQVDHALPLAKQASAGGHRAVIYAGDYASAQSTGLGKALKAEGIKLARECCVPESADCFSQITRLIAEHKITAVLTEFNRLYLHTLLTGLMQLPAQDRPELFAPSVLLPSELVRRFSGLKIVKIKCARWGDAGTAAAQLLTDKLLHHKEIHNLEVPAIL